MSIEINKAYLPRHWFKYPCMSTAERNNIVYTFFIIDDYIVPSYLLCYTYWLVRFTTSLVVLLLLHCPIGLNVIKCVNQYVYCQMKVTFYNNGYALFCHRHCLCYSASSVKCTYLNASILPHPHTLCYSASSV